MEWNTIQILHAAECCVKEKNHGMKWTGTKIRRKQQLDDDDDDDDGSEKRAVPETGLVPFFLLFCSLTRHDLTVSSSCFGYSSGQGTGI